VRACHSEVGFGEARKLTPKAFASKNLAARIYTDKDAMNGLARKNIDPRPRCLVGSAPVPAKPSDVSIIARYGGLKYPVRREWSELQRPGRKVAECGSHRSQCSISSLRS
jgi:hypothetical protein